MPEASRRTALFRSPRFGLHDDPEHVENQRRLTVTEQYLADIGQSDGRPEIPFGPASRAALERVHRPSHLDFLERAAQYGGWLGPDTYIGPDSYTVATEAAGAAVAAVDALLDGSVATAFVLARPPGHHATSTEAMGFCLINHVAVAAAQAIAQGMERVAIVDWDVHHGNGTQDIFYDSAKVFFCSVHQHPFYPGTGMARERGTDRGQGHTLNLPITAGMGDSDYLGLFREHVLPALEAYRPELVIVSAGYDAYVNDPLGGMRVTEAGFAAMTDYLLDVADRFAEGRVLAVLEGGYDPPGLARCVAATLMTLDGERAERYSEGSNPQREDLPDSLTTE
jgi:acetoin utilization deacetylase AcuC-like enzyme